MSKSSIREAPRKILRYAVDGAEVGGPSATYASSFFTSWRNGLWPMSSADAFLLLTCPQMVSTDCPNALFCMDRFSLKAADAGFSSLTATAIFALSMTLSIAFAGCPAAAGSELRGGRGFDFSSGASARSLSRCEGLSCRSEQMTMSPSLPRARLFPAVLGCSS